MKDLDLKIDELDIENLEDFFDISSENDTIKKIENRYVKPKIYRPVKTVKYSNAKKMADELWKPILNKERVFGVVSGNFIFGDFIEAFAVQSNSFIDELTISTLSVSHENIDSLHNLLKGGYVGELNLIVSDYFFAHNRANIQYMYEKLDINNSFQLSAAGVHTKITLIKIGDQKIVMHGSANLRSSQSVENFDIETNEELFDFNHAWHHKIISQYATIKKSIRANKLWETMNKD